MRKLVGFGRAYVGQASACAGLRSRCSSSPLLAIAALTAASLAAQSGAPRRLTADAGTPVEVRVAKSVSSETAHPDERVDFVVVVDVKASDSTVITRGSLAWGVVRNAVPRGRMARDGKLEIEVQGVCLADGSRFPIRAFRSEDGAISQGQETPMSESLLALPALPLMLFLQGKERVLPRGRELTVFTAQPMQIDSDRVTPGPHGDCYSQAQAEAPRAMASADLSTVGVRSSPGGAEIQVDGAFAGNAPATLRLPPGPHRFTVSLPGFALYDRMVQMTAGSEVSLVVVLEPKSTTTPPQDNKQRADNR
ncbi:MAG: PEGA domain-containing protein [Bryobacteraceae bacterium]